MKLLHFLLNSLRAIAHTLLLLLLLLAVFIALRILQSEQVDSTEQLASKSAYLEGIASQQKDRSKRPNVIFILFDDMGYGDIGPGASDNQLVNTPNIDQLAADGIVLTDFYSPASTCTASRAGFLTGRLPARAGMPYVIFPSHTARGVVLGKILNPEANNRLPSEEIILADLFRAAGYATGMVGKWHLGDASPSLPNDMGFDSFYGSLYSNDMKPFALYRDEAIAVEAPVDQRRLTELYTAEATRFIETHSTENFFLYFAHNFPHDPLAVRTELSGKSDAGLYGDVLEEIDGSIGAIVATLEHTGNLNNTLIIISSDNGPWFLGNAGDHRGRKGNTFEGGMRVPFIAHWPAAISGGQVSPAMAMGIDLMPTMLDILGFPAPSDRILDGRSILDVLTRGAESPHDYIYYYDGETLFAVRDQRFKYRGPAGVFYSTDELPFAPAMPQKEWLFDLQEDRRESYDTSDRHPEDLKRLRAAFAAKVTEMEANKRGWR
ncbi:MAG: sulfatase [Haliea sp.]|uniref:sulfatase family protein n=1 Tax=Haliea sp. TaxID=1932666 RepID=UPI0032ED39A1